MKGLLLLMAAAFSSDLVDLAQTDYALKLDPKFLAGERPGHPRVECLLPKALAESLSRAQNTLRLRELYLRVHACGTGSVDLTLEDRSGLRPSSAGRDLGEALGREGWKPDPHEPGRFVR